MEAASFKGFSPSLHDDRPASELTPVSDFVLGRTYALLYLSNMLVDSSSPKPLKTDMEEAQVRTVGSSGQAIVASSYWIPKQTIRWGIHVFN